MRIKLKELPKCCICEKYQLELFGDERYKNPISWKNACEQCTKEWFDIYIPEINKITKILYPILKMDAAYPYPRPVFLMVKNVYAEKIHLSKFIFKGAVS